MGEIKKLNFINIDKVDDKSLAAAKLLVEKKLIKIAYGENTIYFKFPFKICESGSKGNEYLLENIMDFETSNNKVFARQISAKEGTAIDLSKKCKNPKCQFKCCPLVVAGYFKNMCDLDPKLEEKVGNITSIKSNNELLEMTDDLIGIDEVKKELQKLIKFYSKVKTMTDRFNNNNQFYNNYALIGNDGLQQEKVVNIIKSILVSNSIIDDKDYKQFYTLDLEYEIRKNLSDLEHKISDEFKDYRLIYLKDFDKLINLKMEKDDYYPKLINTLKQIIIEKSNTIFIISGKKEKIKLIFNENSEFSSLFGYKWQLNDLSYDDLSKEIFKKLQEINIPNYITLDEIKNTVSQLARESNFKNLNFVEEIYQKTLKNFFESQENNLNNTLLPKTKDNISIDDTMKEIDELIGMNKIKTELRNLSKFLKYNKRLEKINGKSKTLNLHMVFSGNAGTGKTTVARLLADILYNMGYIEERKITEITPKDLIGEYTGQTAPKARKTIENALGGILFIDEAYALAANSSSSKGYGQEAIVELLKCMEDYQDRLVIIFAGYHDEMNDFVSLNPGLKSRIRYYFEFEDYNEDELIQILYMKLKKLNLTIDDEAVRTLKRTISFNMKATNFGNGRYVDNLVNNLLIKHSINIPDDDDTDLLNITLNDVNDLSETNDININDIFKDLDKLIGLSKIKDEFRQLVDYLQYNKKLEKINIYPKNLNLHMVFSGNAGTGKTTVARLLSDIFYNLGYIPENRLTEITAKDLTGEYTGQTAPKVKRQIENALGGVLFIDEAYSLMQNSSSGYGQEAIAELLVGMEKYYDRLIIVFSGYEKEMKDFINVNPGLKSRIGKSFVFEDYTIEELTDILVKFVNDNKLKITNKALDKFKELVKMSMKTKNFGNARWVRNSFDKILLKHSTNTKNSDNTEELITITENDIDIEEIKKSQSTTKSKLGFDLEVKSNNLEKETNNTNLFFEEIESIEEEL